MRIELALGALLAVAGAQRAVAAATEGNTLSVEERRAGWVLLWDGESLFGWERHGGADWVIEGGTLGAASGSAGWLRHTLPFANFVLRAEFRIHGAETDSGIFIRAAAQGDPTKTGCQINVNDRNRDFPTGSIVGRAKAKAPRLRPGAWHRYQITADGDHVVVELDGKRVLDARDGTSRSGHVGLQYVEGGGVEFRGIALRPLGLEPLWNGGDLAGWNRVAHPRARMAPEWSVRDGAIHVEKGPGQLESAASFADFVLQLEARTNPQARNQHPNSGVFFRAEAGKAWSGYEAQIRNEFKGTDRSQPVDFGTGGLYHFQPARRVIASDGEFFTMTVVAAGRSIGTWVDGFPVSRFDDARPEGDDAVKAARLGAGPITLQAHDPTTNLDFRALRIARLPAR